MILPNLPRHRRALRSFCDPADWIVYLYNLVLRRLSWSLLPGRREVTQVTLRGHGSPFHIRLGTTDLFVLEELFDKGEYAPVAEFLENVGRIVDLGANVGFSLRYWHEIFPGARILAVEPDADNCRLAVRNVEEARFSSQVTFVQGCVGSSRRKAKLGGSDEWTYRAVEAAISDGKEVDVFPLEELLETHACGETIDLLKCDIEGDERELFRGCQGWIHRVNAIVAELHPPYTPAALLSDLQNAGAHFEVLSCSSKKDFPVLLVRRKNAPVGSFVVLEGKVRRGIAPITQDSTPSRV